MINTINLIIFIIFIVVSLIFITLVIYNYLKKKFNYKIDMLNHEINEIKKLLLEYVDDYKEHYKRFH